MTYVPYQDALTLTYQVVTILSLLLSDFHFYSEPQCSLSASL